MDGIVEVTKQLDEAQRKIKKDSKTTNIPIQRQALERLVIFAESIGSNLKGYNGNIVFYASKVALEANAKLKSNGMTEIREKDLNNKMGRIFAYTEYHAMLRGGMYTVCDKISRIPIRVD
jgi:hypothetical protein